MVRRSLVCAALVVVGCGRMDTEQSFRAGLPTRDMVEVKAPQQSGQGLEVEGQGEGQGEGEVSELYRLTRDATRSVNGSTLAVLALLEQVTKYPPTSIAGDTAVWGPHTGALDANTWKLSVTRTAPGAYRYELEAKGRSEPDSAFRTLLSGEHVARLDAAGEPVEGFGTGQFTLDWDQAQTLPEHDGSVGKMIATYSRPDETGTASLQVDFRQVRDDQDASKRVDARYGYRATPGSGGEFDFVLLTNWYAGTTPERLSIKSRWQQAGAGRSDVRVSGGDLPGTAEVNECWDTAFASRYLRASYDPRVGYGTEATDCAFSTALYSSL